MVVRPQSLDFNPRSPCGERRGHLSRIKPFQQFQSTLPVRGATPPRSFLSLSRMISIHAPRAGSDPCTIKRVTPKKTFQSTLPVRGATAGGWRRTTRRNHFNPRSPCGERLSDRLSHLEYLIFQSTLPVRGATRFSVRLVKHRERFQSTLPVRGATGAGIITTVDLDISIHAPRAGSDRSNRYSLSERQISIHAPRAGSDVIRPFM